jgi:hypothetical protein
MMGTKSNPGDFDRYAAAGEDEPLFVLLAAFIAAGLLEGAELSDHYCTWDAEGIGKIVAHRLLSRGGRPWKAVEGRDRCERARAGRRGSTSVLCGIGHSGEGEVYRERDGDEGVGRGKAYERVEGSKYPVRVQSNCCGETRAELVEVRMLWTFGYLDTWFVVIRSYTPVCRAR